VTGVTALAFSPDGVELFVFGDLVKKFVRQ
jgi:hypothetical protein